jgi:hypothetical protein
LMKMLHFLNCLTLFSVPNSESIFSFSWAMCVGGWCFFLVLISFCCVLSSFTYAFYAVWCLIPVFIIYIDADGSRSQIYTLRI